MGKGIFNDFDNEGNVERLNAKEDFSSAVETQPSGDSQEASIAAAMNVVNKTGKSDDNIAVTEEEEAIVEITEEDEELAEQMLFKGYAQKDVVIPVLKRKGTFVTVCTSTPQEITLVNEIIFNFIQSKTNESGESVEFPEIEIATLKNAYLIAFTFIGVDGEDICKNRSVAKLEVLKMAVRKYNEFLLTGEVEKSDGLIESIYENLNYRVQELKKLPIPVLDFISEAKYDFESHMFELMGGSAIIPK